MWETRPCVRPPETGDYNVQMKIGFLSHLDLNLYLFRAPLMRELRKRGHRVYAICPEGDKNDALRKLGVDVVNYHVRRQSLNPLREIRTILEIRKILAPLGLDLLHTFTAKPNIYGTLAAKAAGIPVILNLVEGLGSLYIGHSLKDSVIRNIMEILYRQAFRLSNGCIFVNPDDAAYMVSKKIISAEKVRIIKGIGVDLDKFSMQRYPPEKQASIRKALDVESKTVVLMVARAIWDKGIREFYEAAETVKKAYPDAEFLLAGGLDAGNPSCAEESFLKSGSVRWLGHRDDVADILSISDIYVLPSHREGFPVTLMEACAMEKPIITTNVPGCRETVEEGVNGFMVPAGDSHMLAQRIGLLIRDRNLREKMGRKSREKAKREFDVNRILQEYLDYYEKFIPVNGNGARGEE